MSVGRSLLCSTRGLFVTMTYLALDAQWGEVCYATGGHRPILRRHGATREVEIVYGDEGLPLGIEEHSLVADRKAQLAPADTLLRVTDGVVEALSGDKTVFNKEKLAALLGRDGSGPEQLVEDTFEEMGRISPGPREDELSVLPVSWTPPFSGGARS